MALVFYTTSISIVSAAQAETANLATAVQDFESAAMVSQPASQKVLWGCILALISFVVFGVGNDIYAFIKAWLTGASKLWTWSGIWVNSQKRACLIVPTRFTKAMYLTVQRSAYALKVAGHNDEGRSWGSVWCTGGSMSPKHPVGKWRIERWRDDLNQPEVKVTFDNGVEVTLPFERSK